MLLWTILAVDCLDVFECWEKDEFKAQYNRALLGGIRCVSMIVEGRMWRVREVRESWKGGGLRGCAEVRCQYSHECSRPR